MIKLMGSTFYNEKETKAKLCEFISKSDRLSMGSKCGEYEKKFSEYQGRKHSVLFNSGSSANLALTQALLNLEIIKMGDNVGFSALTWATNVMPFIQLGLNPVAVDISQKTLNVGPENIKRVLKNNKLKALWVTNLLGFADDINEIRKLCKEKDIIFLEDNCESLGSEIGDVKLGNFGLASTFSFFVGHHMSTIEGGMVCTDDLELYHALLMVRAHGWSRDLPDEKQTKLKQENSVDDFFNKFTFYALGYNFRPTEITGFLGLEQIKYLEQIVKKRKENFHKFHAVASKNPDVMKLDVSHMNLVSNFAYPLVFKNKDTFLKYKERFERDVEIRPIVGGSIPEQPFFKKNIKIKNEYPEAEKAHDNGFYFPNSPELTEEDINKLCELLKK